MAWMNNVISFKEQLNASAREVTEVGFYWEERVSSLKHCSGKASLPKM